jgi:hypothetical protein
MLIQGRKATEGFIMEKLSGRIVVGAIASAIMLAGCSSTPPAVTVTAAPAIAVPAPRVSDDAGYLSNMRRVYNFTGVSDAKLLDVGNTACESLDAGVTVPKLHTTLTTTPGADPAMGNAILAGAIVFLCDEYLPALNAFTGK